MTPIPFTRREFLHTGLTLASTAATAPAFLQRSALAMMNPGGGAQPGVPQERVLVVVQLSGGNDGLNTVIPFRDDEYHRVRPRLAVAAQEVLRLGRNRDVGLHPAMGALRELWDEGSVSIVEGVGYPNPNRSHFASMDIWHTGQTRAGGHGWLGRYIDNACAGSPAADAGLAGVAIGAEAPLAMQGSTARPVLFESPELFEWAGGATDPAAESVRTAITDASALASPATGSTAEFLTRTALDARLAGARIIDATNQPARAAYPGHPLAQQLRTVASMIHAGLPTRVYYVSMGGFDTHAGQGAGQGQHANLLRAFSESLRAFTADLRESGHDQRVLTMVFSEFGRRVAQNASGGTDHGTAAPMFFAGPMLEAGLVGRAPVLTGLDDGDLRHTVDFRRVYAAVLRDWMGTDPRAVLGPGFSPLGLIRRGATHRPSS